MASEAQKRAIRKYQKENLKQVSLKLHKEKDADIIKWLEGVGNVSEYIKKLIRDEMR